jgi:beta-galactosidase/beta-glucuronidase
MLKSALFVFVLLCHSSFAEEQAVAETQSESPLAKSEVKAEVVSDEVVEETAGENTVETVEETAVVKSEDATPLDYIDFLKVYLAKNKFKDGEELVWSEIDKDYSAIKNDDFQYQKVKEAKLKEAQSEIEKSLTQDRALNVSLVLGKYDFKHEAFPVEAVNVATGIISFTESNIMVSDLYYPGGSSRAEKFLLPTSAELKIENIKNVSPLKVKKEIAEKVTSTFSMARSLSCVLGIETPKVTIDTKKMGKMIFRTFKAKSKYKNLKCYFDNSRTQKAFEI